MSRAPPAQGRLQSQETPHAWPISRVALFWRNTISQAQGANSSGQFQMAIVPHASILRIFLEALPLECSILIARFRYTSRLRHDGVPIAAFELGHLYDSECRPSSARARSLHPNPLKAWFWYQKGADAGEPTALARFAERDERSAVTENAPPKKDAMLLKAFSYYATSAERAQDLDWPDDTWRNWRYHRATLARLLAHDGMMQQVAGCV